MRNPEEAAAASGRLRSSAMFDAEPDEEGIVANVPRRIASRKPNKQKTQSEINSELYFWGGILAGYSKFNLPLFNENSGSTGLQGEPSFLGLGVG